MSTLDAVPVFGPPSRRPPFWRRWTREIVEFTRFLPFAYEAARDRMRRTGRKAFIRDLPMLMRLGFNYYRGMRGARKLDDPDAPPPMFPYDAWLAVNRWTPAARADLIHRLRTWVGPLPKISVVMPVYNPPVQFLDAAIRSVVGQVYGNWELCIADDKSTDPAVHESLRRWATTDPRIKIEFRPENGHISRATNSAAALATGDWILFLDHDDELTSDALGEVALHAAADPEVDFIYSDSDKIDPQNRRYDPEFKPAWSPELLLSYMYFTHLCAARRSLFNKVGGIRPGFEGSQDHDFALRATEQSRKIGHIPQILYHWRAVAGSTATSGSAKPESFTAGRRAIQEAMDRRAMNATVYQPDWALAGGLGIYAADFPDDGPSVSIIIPTKNRLATLKTCVESLKKTTYRNYQVVIVDNESDDPATLNYFSTCGHQILKVNTNGRFSFAAVNNRAAEFVKTEFILLLNNDTEVIEPRWLSRMIGYARQPKVGAVGARLLYPDGRVQHAGVMHGLHDGLAGHAFKLLAKWENGYLSHAKLSRNYMAVTAACLLTPRKLFLDHGGLDEQTFAVAYNDCDYCYKLIDEGYRCVYVAGAELTHYEGLSRGFNDNPREIAAYRQKHGHRVDPYYSPHLSLEDEKFRIQPRRVPRGKVGKIRTAVFSHMLNFTGAPLIQWEVAQALSQRGVIDPVLACVPDGPLREHYSSFCKEAHILNDHPLAPVLARPDTYDAAMDALGRMMKDQWKIDLLYANTLDTVFAVEAATRVGIPTIWNVHESEGWRAFFARYGVLLARRCLDCFPRPYRVIFGSDATRQVYRSWNSAHNFTTIHNPLNLQRMQSDAAQWSRDEARQSLGIDEHDLVLLTVGTVCERKGQLDLIRAAADLPDQLQDRVRCIFVGDRPSEYSSQIASTVRSLHNGLASRVLMVQETDQVTRYYRAGDVFVCSSRVECYPRVTQEAMALGLPLVTTPVFGITEQVRNGINGIYYEPGNIRQLTEALTDLLSDEPLRRKMSELAPIVLQGAKDFDRTIDEYAQVFQEASLTAI